MTDPLIALGKDYIIYRKQSGELFGMGYNHSGNLGVGDFKDRLTDSTEISIPVDEKIKDIACVFEHSVLLHYKWYCLGFRKKPMWSAGPKK